MEQDLTVIQNFNVLPKQSLEMLKERLALRMKPAELIFCARHYKGRNNANVNVCELRFIDALACPTRLELSKIALGEMLSDHADIARTFANAVSKLKALGKSPEKPYTLQDLADLSSRCLTAVNQKDITEPIGFHCTAAHYASRGYNVQFPLECTHGHFDVLHKLPFSLQPSAEYADALILLIPAPESSSTDFDAAVNTLLQNHELTEKLHCICDLSSESAARACLRISNGGVLNLGGLPMQFRDPLALTENHTGLLFALPQQAAQELIQAAQAPGLGAYELGIADHAGYLIVKYDKDVLLTLSASYLRNICFIRSYTVHVDRILTNAKPLCMPLLAPMDALDEGGDGYDSVLRTLPPLRTRNAAWIDDTSYHAAILCALKAYCTAAAAGSDPARIWLDAQIFMNQSNTPIAKTAGELLGTILGLYRTSMELKLPIHSNAVFQQSDQGIAILAGAPSDMVIPSRLQGNGRIYLVAPKFGADGMPVWSELRALISYLRRNMLTGKIKAVRAFCCSTPADELTEAATTACGVILNPHGMELLDTPCTCAFLVETDDELEGDLIAVSYQHKHAPNAVISDNIS